MRNQVLHRILRARVWRCAPRRDCNPGGAVVERGGHAALRARHLSHGDERGGARIRRIFSSLSRSIALYITGVESALSKGKTPSLRRTRLPVCSLLREHFFCRNCKQRVRGRRRDEKGRNRPPNAPPHFECDAGDERMTRILSRLRIEGRWWTCSQFFLPS